MEPLNWIEANYQNTNSNESMTYFPCPYLESDVELTDERENHISENHPDLLPEHRKCVADALKEPDQIQQKHAFWKRPTFQPVV
ncbi:hypothetical protein EPICR_30269 [Candidatus Desulfarcum epimagneticum]|uniref:Uncharacterized protein n=1 Tax=uncultured Desulfobacteraceae bacterium TaxID=218296 RepID=A0A484HGH9_9BACT|nr:hypothetical protein EPICR_30269 [uncultured Desulfobacteraceae bacterium]